MTLKYLQFLVGVSTAGADKPTSVAERDGLCLTAALAGNFVALSFLHDLTDFNQSIDEEHSGEGAGVIACHTTYSAALGAFHLLVPLLSQ